MLSTRFLIIIVFVISSCGNSKEQEEVTNVKAASNNVQLTDIQVKNSGIEKAVPVSEKLNITLQVNGTIEVPPQNIVSVSFPFGGYLKTTKLLPGMHVSKGEIIGIMQDQSLVQLQQDYLVAASRLNYLELEYKRQKTLQENNVNSAKTFQQTETDFTSQQVLVKGYAQKLQMIHINPERLTASNLSSTVPVYSPINGFVSKVNVNIGKYVNPTDVLFELINPDDMHAALVVFEKDIAKIRKGQKVQVALVDEPGKQYLCEVILVTKNVNENRTGTVHCHFEKMPEKLLPGMFLNASIVLSGSDEITVPEEAVVRFENKEYILEETQNNNFKMVAIQTGIRENGKVQIVNATEILSGKPVITKNAYSIFSMMKNTED
jgi:cobalt-zinc-cadmium efflux system membrane fusion protein